MKSTILEICVSERKGRKERVQSGDLVSGSGLRGDYHAGTWHRQVSLLPEEQIQQMRDLGAQLTPGAFGENLITRGLDLSTMKLGQRLRVGETAVLLITQLGKECHTPCEIFHSVGQCIMPRFGIFCRVRRGGVVQAGDPITTDASLDRTRYAVVTLSDRCSLGKREDLAGPEICRMLEPALGGGPLETVVLPDNGPALQRELVRLCDQAICDLVVTTGGTGLSPRDVTPEATLAVVDRQVPGMAEAIRAAGMVHTPHAMLSRGVCGLRGQTLIVNLSGSPKAVQQQLEALLPALPHALETASGRPLDCGSKP